MVFASWVQIVFMEFTLAKMKVLLYMIRQCGKFVAKICGSHWGLYRDCTPLCFGITENKYKNAKRASQPSIRKMLVQNYVGRWPFHQARWFCLSASRFRKHRRTSKTILDSYILSKMIVESTTASLTCPPPSPASLAAAQHVPPDCTRHHQAKTVQIEISQDFLINSLSGKFTTREGKDSKWWNTKKAFCWT